MARILVVDDQQANVRLIERILAANGHSDVMGTTDPRQVVTLYLQRKPDLIMLDLHMPHLDGFGVLERLREISKGELYLPIIVLTADISQEARMRALQLGAKDFLVKPFDAAEVGLRIENLLEIRRLHQRLSDRNRDLEMRVIERTTQLEQAHIEILERLAAAAEFRDDNTGEHVGRVAERSALLAHRLGLGYESVDLIRRASTLHDVGKIGVPDAILLKPGRLTADEFDVVKRHTTIGAKILGRSDALLLRSAEEIAFTHHERWDGSGYPSGLAMDDIPISGRIVMVADVFDALTHDRPYKSAWSFHDAVAEIEIQAGRQFDPAVVGAFLDSMGTAAVG
ncbi:MAG: HD domain-containing phosphohydrolase [Actinomycetota bacterium]